MTLTQTVDIPANRRVRFDFVVPREIPEGTAQVEFKVVPFVKKKEKPADNGKFRISRKELEEMRKNSPTLHEISGILSHLGDVDLDEAQMARLAKHL